ncbi:MAG: hypothetical protein SNH73_00455 [Rikenellaceae bacterium]
MNKFSFYITLFVVAFTTLLASCSSDEVTATLTLSQDSVYFTELGETLTITYTGSNIDQIEVTDVPDGWEITVKKSKKTITIVGPSTQEDFENSLTASTVTFTSTSVDDLGGADYLTVGTTNYLVDLTDQQANSFIASIPNAIYRFNACSIGEDQGEIVPSEISILWQTYPQPLAYTRFSGDVVEFYVQADEDDNDEDGLTDDLIEGNAVIAAYDSSGDIIWSWHVWVSDFSADDSPVTLNNIEVMDRNLGACNNSTLDEDAILASYGLYYQWGRKDPFVGPYYYNAQGSTDGTMKNESKSSVYITYTESTSKKGTVSYTTENPLTFILGVEDSNYDWIYSNDSSDLWSESGSKSIYDPCPKGWRVASHDLYEGLMIPTITTNNLDMYAYSYGWPLTDPLTGNSNLFMGLGRRGYITGKIQNVNVNETRPAPWVGYYWSAASNDTSGKSTALYFSYDNEEVSGNQIAVSSYHRANGMQIRCQRD